MGVLTDIVVAHVDQAQAVLQTDAPYQALHGLEARGLDTPMLGALHAVLTGTAPDAAWAEGVDLLASEGDEGPWVFSVPGPLVHALATLDGARVSPAAEAWAATEAVRREAWSAEAAAQLLAELVRLARQARGEGAALLMWMSLHAGAR